MKRTRSTESQPVEVLRQAAMRQAETEEGIACAGTVLEKRTIKVRNKAFLFLGTDHAMLKLGDSLEAANGLAVAEPARFKVGANGWVTITFGDAGSLPMDLLAAWVEESYRLFAPKKRDGAKATRK